MSIRERKRTRQINIRLTPDEFDLIRAEAISRGVSVTRLMVSATLDKINDEAHPFKGTLRRLRESGEV